MRLIPDDYWTAQVMAYLKSVGTPSLTTPNPLIAEFKGERAVTLTLLVAPSLREAMDWARRREGGSLGRVRAVLTPEQADGYRPGPGIRVVVVGGGNYSVIRHLERRGFHLERA